MEKRTPVEKSVVRNKLKVIDRKWSAKSNALKSKTNAQKALKHHQLLAKEESKGRKAYEAKHGTFDQRFDNYSKWRDNLGKKK